MTDPASLRSDRIRNVATLRPAGPRASPGRDRSSAPGSSWGPGASPRPLCRQPLALDTSSAGTYARTVGSPLPIMKEEGVLQTQRRSAPKTE